jgi:hypothetical protein
MCKHTDVIFWVNGEMLSENTELIIWTRKEKHSVRRGFSLPAVLTSPLWNSSFPLCHEIFACGREPTASHVILYCSPAVSTSGFDNSRTDNGLTEKQEWKSEYREGIAFTVYEFLVTYGLSCRLQWTRGLRHEPSSPARTLGSSVQILLKPLISVRLFCVCIVLSVGSGFATGSSPSKGSCRLRMD